MIMDRVMKCLTTRVLELSILQRKIMLFNSRRTRRHRLTAI